ncbi:FkbM family methyltransferase [bacterium]|nr:FkbM family methyltransferase [bacterium]
MKHLFGERLVAVDIGCNTGAVLENINSNFCESVLYGIEPNKSLIPLLKEKFGKRATIFNIGLGSRCSEGALNITSNSHLSSELEPNDNYRRPDTIYRETNSPLKLESRQGFVKITGDSFMKENSIDGIDYLSINTQGTELEILRGFSDALKHHNIKTIQIEVDFTQRYLSRQYSLADVARFMEDFDYKLLDILQIKNGKSVGVDLMQLLYVCSSVDINGTP